MRRCGRFLAEFQPLGRELSRFVFSLTQEREPEKKKKEKKMWGETKKNAQSTVQNRAGNGAEPAG